MRLPGYYQNRMNASLELLFREFLYDDERKLSELYLLGIFSGWGTWKGCVSISVSVYVSCSSLPDIVISRKRASSHEYFLMLFEEARSICSYGATLIRCTKWKHYKAKTEFLTVDLRRLCYVGCLG